MYAGLFHGYHTTYTMAIQIIEAVMLAYSGYDDRIGAHEY